MFKRTIKNNLTFAGEPLLRGRHKIHPYPAMLHPLLVDYLISEFAKENDIVFDPMCGSGVTLLQSNLKGHDSFGFDINPDGIEIAKNNLSQLLKERNITNPVNQNFNLHVLDTIAELDFETVKINANNTQIVLGTPPFSSSQQESKNKKMEILRYL